MARIDNLKNFLTDIADTIRAKTGDTAKIHAEDFDTEIMGITTGVMTQEEYDNAMLLSEDILGVIGEQTADAVGPVLNGILGTSDVTDIGGNTADVQAVFDDILGGVE